ncbi:MAG: PDZ domain-containing protein [Planctomycetota bacterium]
MARWNLPIRTLIATAGLCAAITPATAAAIQPSITWDIDNDRVDETISVRIDNDDVEITINGEQIDSDRVRRIGNRVQIIDENGFVSRTITIPTTPRLRTLPGGLKRLPVAAPPAPSTPALATTVGTPARVEKPSVMLGVTLSDPTDAVLQIAGLDGRSAVLVESVLDDLPADRAGLRRFDLITAIDGKSDIKRADITKALSTKRPNETMMLKVNRAGENLNVEVHLDKFNATALGIANRVEIGLELPPEPASPAATLRDWQSLTTNTNDVVESAIQAALGALNEVKGSLPRDVQAQIDMAEDQLAQSLRQLGETPKGLFFPSNDGTLIMNNKLFNLPTDSREDTFDEAMAILKQFRRQVEDSEQNSVDLDRLDDRLDRLERRLEKLDWTLDQTADRLETLLDRLEERP